MLCRGLPYQRSQIFHVSLWNQFIIRRPTVATVSRGGLTAMSLDLPKPVEVSSGALVLTWSVQRHPKEMKCKRQRNHDFLRRRLKQSANNPTITPNTIASIGNPGTACCDVVEVDSE